MEERISKTPTRCSRGRAIGLRVVLVAMGLVPVAAVLGHALLDRGIIWFQEPDANEFPTRGLDVSHHQGIVDFQRVRAAGFSFVYVKATEGATHVDSRFRANWTGARTAGLAVGAYHFFTLCRSGQEQADNFMRLVPQEEMLPPVIDLEFGGNCGARPTLRALEEELRVFVSAVEVQYGQSPVFYVTYEFLEAYPLTIADWPQTQSLWIRDIYRRPRLPNGFDWQLWQYHCRARVPGIEGPVDLNVMRPRPPSRSLLSSPLRSRSCLRPRGLVPVAAASRERIRSEGCSAELRCIRPSA